MADTPLSAQMEDEYKVSKWNRNTVADGTWLQKYTIEKLNDRDIFLANAIDTNSDDIREALNQEIETRTNDDVVISAALTGVSGDFYTFSANVENSASTIVNTIETFSSYVESSAAALDQKINNESNRAQDREDELANKIYTLEAATDVIMVYGTYQDFINTSAELWNVSAGYLTENDVVKILIDDSQGNSANQTYYQAKNVDYDTSSCTWTKIGELDPYYNTAQIDEYFNILSGTITDNYLSANENAVSAGKNIKIDYEQNKPKITIHTKEDVEFNNVSSKNVSATNVTALTATGNSAKFTNISANKISADLFKSDLGTVDTFKLSFNSANGDNLTATNGNILQLTASTLYGQSNNSNVDSLIGSAQSGAAASAWVSANSAGLNIQGGYGISTGTNENGNLVINIRNNGCNYDAYGLALGENSTAIGAVNGHNAFAFGDYCYANGANAFAAGCHSTAGKFAVAMGYNNVATGDYSLALGYNSTAEVAYSVAIGRGLSGTAQTTLGKFNESVEGAQLIVGDGQDRGYNVTARKNILVIKDDKVSAADFSAGNVSLSSLTNMSAFGNGITNTATFNLSAVKLSAGQGIGFKNDTNGVLSITAEGTTYQAGDYISTTNKTIAVTGDLITSAEAGSAASAWINTNNNKIAYTANFSGSNSVITGYGTSAFAGGISSISVGNTVFTGRNVNLYDSNNIDFTTANNSLTIDLHNNISLGESETTKIFMNTTEDVIGSDGPVIVIENAGQSQLQLYNNKITRNSKQTTWDKVISASNGNFVSAYNQPITVATATTLPNPIPDGIYYIV